MKSWLCLLCLLAWPLKGQVIPADVLGAEAHREELWEESCRWTVGEQKARSEAARAALSRDPAIIDFLIEKLPTLQTTLKYRGVWGVLNPLQDQGLRFYLAGLKHPETTVRKSTLIMLAEAKVTLDDSVVDRLIEFTLDDRLYGRVLAVLEAHHRSEGLDAALQRLQMPETKPDLLIASCAYAGSCGKERAVPVLLNLFNAADFMVREAALNALAKMGESAQGAALKMLGHSDPARRRQAVLLLGMLHCDATRLHPLLLDQDRVVRATVTRVLRELGEDRGALERILGRAALEDPWMRGALAAEPLK